MKRRVCRLTIDRLDYTVSMSVAFGLIAAAIGMRGPNMPAPHITLTSRMEG